MRAHSASTEAVALPTAGALENKCERGSPAKAGRNFMKNETPGAHDRN